MAEESYEAYVPEDVLLDRCIAEQFRRRLGELERTIRRAPDLNTPEVAEFQALTKIHDAAWRQYDPDLFPDPPQDENG